MPRGALGLVSMHVTIWGHRGDCHVLGHGLGCYIMVPDILSFAHVAIFSILHHMLAGPHDGCLRLSTP